MPEPQSTNPLLSDKSMMEAVTPESQSTAPSPYEEPRETKERPLNDARNATILYWDLGGDMHKWNRFWSMYKYLNGAFQVLCIRGDPYQMLEASTWLREDCYCPTGR